MKLLFLIGVLLFNFLSNAQPYCSSRCVPSTQPIANSCDPSLKTGSPALALSGSFEHIGLNLLAASKHIIANNFNTLLHSIEQQYSNNPQAMLQILTAQDQDGFNILMRSALIGDLNRLAHVLRMIKKTFGHNPELVFEIFQKKDKNLINLLGHGVYSADRRIVNLILGYAIELLRTHPKLFYLFINAGEVKEGWKPLADAADDNLTEIIQMIVQAAQIVLGKTSTLYNEFINAPDQAGFTALGLAQNFDNQLFLLKSGAHPGIDPEQTDPKLKRAVQLGKQLILASNKSEFEKFKQILHQGVTEFAGQEGKLFNFFYARDDAGWNALIHTAAAGQYEYVVLLLDALQANFKDKYMKSLIIGNVDFEGRTPLHLAIARRNFKIAQLIIRKLMDYSENNPLLYSFINSPDQLSGFTPFMFLVYVTGEYDPEAANFLKIMLDELAQFFGPESRIFGRILNSRDYNGWNVLAYAAGKKITNLLRSYGAIDTIQKPIPELSKFFSRHMITNNYNIIPLSPTIELGQTFFAQQTV